MMPADMTGSTGPAPRDRDPRVKIRGSQGVQVGDHATQRNIFITQYIEKQIIHTLPGSVAAPVWVGDVPPRPPAFQARELLLAALGKHGAGVPVVRAVTGMWGVGKTQVAAAYARLRIEEGWRLVAWVNAGDMATVLNGIGEIAARLGVNDQDGDLEGTAAAVRHWLEADGERCLVVFDNATDLDGLRRVVPAAGKAHVVVTSSVRAASELGQAIPVDVFTEEEALAFLAERTGITDSGGARHLAAELGYLPLALAQAAAVIARQRLSYATYLDRWRQLPVGTLLPPIEPGTREVVATVLLSMDSAGARKSSGLRGALLDLLAVLSADGVKRALLYAAAADGALKEATQASDVPVAVDPALARLAEASLLRFSGDGSSVNAHRLVMRVVRELRAQEGSLAAAAATAAIVLRAASESLGPVWQNPAASRDLVRQITALHEHITPFLTETDTALITDLLTLRGWAALCLTQLGDNPTQAIEYGQRLTADSERVLGEDHPDTLGDRANLAYAYWSAEQPGEAIPLLERTLADYERIIGADHSDTLTVRNNLAAAYQAAGRLGEAIPLLEQNLADRQRVLGIGHPDVLTSRNNLAAAYKAAGRLGEAIPLLERNVAGSERSQGGDHLNTLRSRGNLAAVHLLAGRVSEAIPLYERNVTDCERVLGSDHPQTLQSRTHLAMAYQTAGRLDEAIPLLERTLADCEQVLSADHPETLQTRNALADAYEAVGRLGEAIPLYERTLADRQRVLSGDHPDALTSQNNLADAYETAGRLDEAIPLYERTLADRQRVLGGDHPQTLASQNNLARAYTSAGRLGEAIPLYKQTLAGCQRVLGADHPDTRTVRENLASAQRQSGSKPHR
jgi:tetratricopeptide (TPR) repeat protein